MSDRSADGGPPADGRADGAADEEPTIWAGRLRAWPTADAADAAPVEHTEPRQVTRRQATRRRVSPRTGPVDPARVVHVPDGAARETYRPRAADPVVVPRAEQPRSSTPSPAPVPDTIASRRRTRSRRVRMLMVVALVVLVVAASAVGIAVLASL